MTKLRSAAKAQAAIDRMRSLKVNWTQMAELSGCTRPTLMNIWTGKTTMVYPEVEAGIMRAARWMEKRRVDP